MGLLDGFYKKNEDTKNTNTTLRVPTTNEEMIKVLAEFYLNKAKTFSNEENISEFMDMCNKVSESTQVFYMYLKQKGQEEFIDKARLDALDAWTNGNPTPKNYSSLYRKRK
jgi:nucleoid-associated protein YejK